MEDKVNSFVKLRDGLAMASEAVNELIETYDPELGKAENAVVPEETTFKTLRFEAQSSMKLGAYEVAYEQSNLPDKWQHAINILRSSNATIKERYYGNDYEFSIAFKDSKTTFAA